MVDVKVICLLKYSQVAPPFSKSYLLIFFTGKLTWILFMKVKKEELGVVTLYLKDEAATVVEYNQETITCTMMVI